MLLLCDKQIGFCVFLHVPAYTVLFFRFRHVASFIESGQGDRLVPKKKFNRPINSRKPQSVRGRGYTYNFKLTVTFLVSLRLYNNYIPKMGGGATPCIIISYIWRFIRKMFTARERQTPTSPPHPPLNLRAWGYLHVKQQLESSSTPWLFMTVRHNMAIIT